MSRNRSTQALILSQKIQGESNRTICMLTPDEGLTYATLFGGPKSKLRSLVSPWNSGTIYLYADEVKKSCKITDFDVQKYHLSFRTSLFKSWAAMLTSEILIRTKCGGSPLQAWVLANGFFDGMEIADESLSKTGLLRFLWRYLGILGVRPESSICARCGKRLFSPNARKSELNTVNYYLYSERENGFVCPDCANQGEEGAYLSSGAVFYLSAVENMEPKDSRSLFLTNQEFGEIKGLAFRLLEGACGSRLKTLESAAGIL